MHRSGQNRSEAPFEGIVVVWWDSKEVGSKFRPPNIIQMYSTGLVWVFLEHPMFRIGSLDKKWK
jgi:hypothetical protein